MPSPNPLLALQGGVATISLPNAPQTFTLPLDGSNVTAWTDFLKWIIEHPEVINALLQLLAMLLGGLTPPPPKP